MPLPARLALPFLACLAALPVANPPSVSFAAPAEARAEDLPLAALLDRGDAIDAIVLFEDQDIQAEAKVLRERAGLEFDDRNVLDRKASRLKGLRSATLDQVRRDGGSVRRTYRLLPMAAVRLTSRRSLERLLGSANVRAVVPDRSFRPALDSVSADLVRQPAAQALGAIGTGTTVLVIDAGVDYTQSDFGPCTAPGVPAGTCRVVYASNLSGTGGNLDTSVSQHGTNIAGIVAGMAPGASIASINVFGTAGAASVSTILDAIDWGIANRATYGIVAMNLSISDGVRNTSPCANRFVNPFVDAFAAARSAGILPVASSGNGGFPDGLSNPACTPTAVSVGAVYSQNWGSVSGGVCSDATTAADQVACFSNSATFLSLLAPGAFITAGGRQLAGTSQSTPFVAGAIAVLRAAYASESLAATVDRLVTTGKPVTDLRNGLVKPRLDVADALRPSNDDFVRAAAISAASGVTPLDTRYATTETGEPLHAEVASTSSVWWRWTAPASGVVRFDTRGSGFDTLLGAYTGSTVSSLTAIGANDDDGSAGGASTLWFRAQGGQAYSIAVAGKSGARGLGVLNWHLDTSPSADLRVNVTVNPASPALGDQVVISVDVTNLGPGAATGVVVNGSVGASLAFEGSGGGCSTSVGAYTCPIGTLGPGQSVSRVLLYRAQALGTASVTASLGSEIGDPVPANNSDLESVNVRPASPRGRSIPLPPWSVVVLTVLLAIGYRAGRRARVETRVQ